MKTEQKQVVNNGSVVKQQVEKTTTTNDFKLPNSLVFTINLRGGASQRNVFTKSRLKEMISSPDGTIFARDKKMRKVYTKLDLEKQLDAHLRAISEDLNGMSWKKELIN